MRRRLSPTLIMIIALFGGAVSGCGSNKNQTTTVANKQVGAPGAVVTFVAPRPGATVGSTITARVTLKNFKLVPYASGTQVQQGQGQLHFSMDGGKYDQPKYSGPNGVLAAKLKTNGKYSPAFQPTITYNHLPTGKHTLAVFLANKDRSNTGVNSQIRFRVK